MARTTVELCLSVLTGPWQVCLDAYCKRHGRQQMGLYHRDLGLPKGLDVMTGKVRLEWTRHAEHARVNDRYGDVTKWGVLDLDMCDVIEVEADPKTMQVSKFVLRTGHGPDYDVVYVVIPRPAAWVVKTVWLNDVNDTHKTLDITRYDMV